MLGRRVSFPECRGRSGRSIDNNINIGAFYVRCVCRRFFPQNRCFKSDAVHLSKYRYSGVENSDRVTWYFRRILKVAASCTARNVGYGIGMLV